MILKCQIALNHNSKQYHNLIVVEVLIYYPKEITETIQSIAHQKRRLRGCATNKKERKIEEKKK